MEEEVDMTKKWHPGQVVMLWIAAALSEWLLWTWFHFLETIIALTTAGDVVELAVFALLCAIPMGMFIVTWKWFGTRNG